MTAHRRIFGLETEYGLTCIDRGTRRLSPDDMARYLFRPIVARAHSSNLFLENGGRLYLDVGSHPEYATAECDNLMDLLVHDRAGEYLMQELVDAATAVLRAEAIDGEIFLFKNNTDSTGNSYGCHENFLVRRRNDYVEGSAALLPFLVTRQLICGAGKILQTPRGPVYAFSQRADHMWEGVSSATTRSRPLINTRDEPHADAEQYRRMHVIVGDSNMCEATTLVKVASMDLVLRILESGRLRRDLELENPMRTIRDVSQDITGTAPITLANGAITNAIEIQEQYLQDVRDYIAQDTSDVTPLHHMALDLWSRTLGAIRSGDFSDISHDIDWAIKLNLLRQYMTRHSVDLGSAAVAQVELRYHDIDPRRGLFRKLESSGHATRLTTEADVQQAMKVAPQTTRARLRGEFITRARALGKDVAVDWMHLKINDTSQRTVVCKDPFLAHDERVDTLMTYL